MQNFQFYVHQIPTSSNHRRQLVTVKWLNVPSQELGLHPVAAACPDLVCMLPFLAKATLAASQVILNFKIKLKLVALVLVIQRVVLLLLESEWSRGKSTFNSWKRLMCNATGCKCKPKNLAICFPLLSLNQELHSIKGSRAITDNYGNRKG